MSSNVGLSTPRGSGTSGYVQRNLSLLKPRNTGAGAPYTLDGPRPPKTRKPDQAILTHDRLRDIEIKVLDLRDQLEDEGDLEDDDIDAECEKLRTKLTGDMQRREKRDDGRNKGTGKGIKGYQVHELAEAKAVESEKLRRALGLKGQGGGSTAGEGGEEEHPMARQERRKREREMERAREMIEREEKEREREKEKERDVEREQERERERVRGRDRDRNRERQRSYSESSSRSRSP